MYVKLSRLSTDMQIPHYILSVQIMLNICSSLQSAKYFKLCRIDYCLICSAHTLFKKQTPFTTLTALVMCKIVMHFRRNQTLYPAEFLSIVPNFNLFHHLKLSLSKKP